MYISKAMLNMRGDSLGSTINPTIEWPWSPYSLTGYSSGNLQSGGMPTSTEPTAIIVFSSGDTVPDDVWSNQAQALFSLSTLRTYLAANAPGVVMDTAFASSGIVRVINVGGGKRTLDLNNSLGRFSYAKAFNRMYLMIGTNTTVMSTGTAVIASVFEFTPQDLISMGAPLTDNGDGTFNLNGTISLNNITFS